MGPMPLSRRTSRAPRSRPESWRTLVVLGSDPTQIDPLGIEDIQVERTIVGGETVYGG